MSVVQSISDVVQDSIETRVPADGTEYRLPRRDLGPLRLVDAIFFIVGLLFTLIAGAMSIAAIRVRVFHAPMSGSPPTWPMLAFMLLCVLIGLIVCSGALGFFVGYSIVRIDDSHLIAINTFGLFRWKRMCDLADIKSLIVSRGETTSQGKRVTTGPLADVSALAAEFEDARKPMILAIGYPSQVLQSLGRAIGEPRHIDVQLKRNDRKSRRDKVSDQPLALPQDSKIVVRRADGPLTLAIPTAGLRQGSRGLFTFSVCWLTFCVVHFSSLVVANANGAARTSSNNPWVFALLIGVFSLVGVGTLLGSIFMVDLARSSTSSPARR